MTLYISSNASTFIFFTFASEYLSMIAFLRSAALAFSVHDYEALRIVLDISFGFVSPHRSLDVFVQRLELRHTP